jgi:hypothetical protein
MLSQASWKRVRMTNEEGEAAALRETMVNNVYVSATILNNYQMAKISHFTTSYKFIKHMTTK